MNVDKKPHGEPEGGKISSNLGVLGQTHPSGLEFLSLKKKKKLVWSEFTVLNSADLNGI